MKKICILAGLIIVLPLACKKVMCGCLPYQVYYLKATVIETNNIDCGRPLLDFSEDSLRIHAIMGSNEERFIITTLDASLNVVGKKLFVSVAQPGSEDFACTALGPGYAHLKLLDAKPRD